MGLLQEAIDVLRENVESTMRQLEHDLGTAFAEAILNTGNELNRLIDRFSLTYHEIMKETVDKLDAEALRLLNEIQNRVAQFQESTGNALEELRRSAQSLANTIPFADKTPFLIAIHPAMVIPGPNPSYLHLKVNYAHAGKYGTQVTLKSTDGLVAKMFHCNETDIYFELPPMKSQSESAPRVGYLSWELELPYLAAFYHFHPTIARYRIALGILPFISGTAHVSYRTDTQVAEPQYMVRTPAGTPGCVSPWANEGFAQFNGNKWYPDHWHTELQDLFPDPGFEFDLSDARRPVLDLKDEHGKYEVSLILAKDRITVKAGTYAKEGKDIGIVSARVRCYQTRMVTHTTHREEAIPLPWSENRLVSPRSGEVIERLEFTAYTGRTDQFGAPALIPGCLLRINAEPKGVWRIWTDIPKELSISLQQLPTEIAQNFISLNNLAHLVPFIDRLCFDSSPQIQNLKIFSKRFQSNTNC